MSSQQPSKIEKLSQAEAEILRNQRYMFFILRNMNLSKDGTGIWQYAQDGMNQIEKFLTERGEHY